MPPKKYPGIWNPNDPQLVRDRSRYVAGARDAAAKRAQALSLRDYIMKKSTPTTSTQKIAEMKERILQLEDEIRTLKQKIKEEEKAGLIAALQAQLKTLQGGKL